MKTKHLRSLNWEFLIDELDIILSLIFGRIRRSETLGHCKLHVIHNFRSNQKVKIGVASQSIPIISDMTTIHDLTEQVSKIKIRYLWIFRQVIVENVTANLEITIIEIIIS
jgi:hypothetical protein